MVLGAQKKKRILCCREVQNSIAQSVKQLIDDKIREAGLTGFYTSTQTGISGANATQFMFSGLRNETVDSIKSKEGVDIALIEEAQNVSQRSLDILIPTIRAPNSELWFLWNPESEDDPVDKMFRRQNVPPDAIVRRVSYKDNPWFPDVLKRAMEFDLATDPEKAAHIWHGEYQAAPKGAYYAALLAEATAEGRIGRVPIEPTLETHVAFDLGNGPNMAAWFAQFKGREVRIVDYFEGDEEARDKGWPWYISRLRQRAYDYAPIILPHDGKVPLRGNGKSDEQTLIDAGFRTRIVPKMDKGQAVKLVQGFIPKCWFDESKCADGLRALRAFRADIDEKLHIDRGPIHDWSSHPSDAFRHLVQAYEEPRIKRKKGEQLDAGESAWMG